MWWGSGGWLPVLLTASVRVFGRSGSEATLPAQKQLHGSPVRGERREWLDDGFLSSVLFLSGLMSTILGTQRETPSFNRMGTKPSAKAVSSSNTQGQTAGSGILWGNSKSLFYAIFSPEDMKLLPFKSWHQIPTHRFIGSQRVTPNPRQVPRPRSQTLRLSSN